MSNNNLNKFMSAIAQTPCMDGQTISIVTTPANNKRVMYLQLLNASGEIIAQSGKCSNVWGDECLLIVQNLVNNSMDASFATAKVEEYNERGHEEQVMTYCKHVDWVSEVSNIYDKQASKKDPHLYNVTIEDVKSLDINKWIYDSIGEYIYTDEMIKEYNMVYDYMVKLPCGDYITKHTWDCYAKAINKYKNLLAGNKKGYKKHSKIELRLKDTCMA